MTVKRPKPSPAPGHSTSLVDAELEARTPLATPSTRRKEKSITDPTLGSDLTAKILKSAVEQRERGDDSDGEPLVPFSLQFTRPDDPESLLADEAPIELETDLEVIDEESRQYFELFEGTAATVSRKLDRAIKSTPHLDAKIRNVYAQLGTVLRLYKSGKLPKAVNAVASQDVAGWLDLLNFSEPLRWSPNAVLAVTALFIQTASDGRCQTFMHEILLSYVRELLDGARKLPQPVFHALLKSARRPKCFVLGILLPLAQEPTCSLKEARMISLIAGRVHLPRDHANAFLIKVCEGDITPVRTIFIARYIAKGQALAIQAIDAIVAYFMRHLAIGERQPLIWHRALVDFVKRYGSDLTMEQREAIAELVAKHSHPHITPEIFKCFEQVPPREDVGDLGMIPTF
jgi:essential nuclear protein 1